MKTAAIVSRLRKAYPVGLARPLAVFSLLLAIPALAQGQSSSTSNSPPSSSNGPAITTNKIVLPQIPSAQLMTDRLAYGEGQSVLLTFKVVNSTGKPIRYDFSSGQQASFSVTDSKGNDVWDSPIARGSFQGITHLTLAPGKSQTYQATWNQRDNKQRPVPNGIYTATAQLAPMPKIVVTGGIIVNTNTDPSNTGMPTKGKGESGEVLQRDVTPPVESKIQITIRAAKPLPASHSAPAR